MDITVEGWAVVMSKPAAEFVAKDALRRRGYRSFLPVYRRILRGHRKSRGTPQLRPLFQSYLFVELHPGQPWLAILSTTGVCDLVRQVGAGDLPALMCPELIHAIRAQCDAGLFDDRRKVKAEPGDQLRVVEGPFAGFMTTLQEEVDDKARALTMLRLFNREVRAVFEARSLEPTKAQPTPHFA